MEFYIFQGEMA